VIIGVRTRDMGCVCDTYDQLKGPYDLRQLSPNVPFPSKGILADI
jgi:hypothetical protein